MGRNSQKVIRRIRIRTMTYTKICLRLHDWLLKLLGIWVYPSYWNYKTCKKIAHVKKSVIYYSARPNPGAGIGHQMANWIAGYWYARQFGLEFAHLPFSTQKWEDFLGFGIGEKSVEELKREGYKTRRLPLFKENNLHDLQLQRAIMASYAGQKVVFIAEQDQFYRDQFGVMKDIQNKFYEAPSRANDHLIYNPSHFNIAIHVRRGDIMMDSSNPNLAMRYLSNEYFERVLTQVVDRVKTDKPIHIYFFSQGKPEDYPEFAGYANLHWCMDMGAQDSFLHMVYADLLITSKSSFSYKPALLNRGIKVCPKKFWHSYPNTEDWVMCDNEGNVDWKNE